MTVTYQDDQPSIGRSGDPVGDADPTPEELRGALDRLSLVLSATGVGVWERDLATNVVTWSEGMYRLFGRSPEQFSGSPDEVLSYVHPLDRKLFRTAYETAVSGPEGTFEQEFRIVRGDGEIRWAWRRGQVRRDAAGNSRAVLGVALDITDRKQAEEANARLASIVSNADDAIMALSADGTILTWNPAAERLFGHTAAEAVGQSARILYPKDAEAEFDSLYKRLRAGEHARFEGSRRSKSGDLVEVSVVASPILNRDGHVVGVSAVIRDVAHRKRTEQKLVETLALLLQTNNQRKLALVAGRMGTFEVDLERGGVSWSDEIYEQVGIDRNTTIATLEDVERFIHPEDRTAVRMRRYEALAAGETFETEFRIVRTDGEVRWVYVRAQAFGDSDRPARVYGISMDITERKEREAHIRFLMSEVSHRSKNLLAVVQAIASQTARSTRSPLDFAKDFGARLKSLAASLDLLVRQEWRGVSVKELVQSQLGHYGERDVMRVGMSGPDVLLSPLAAQYLGMALHELSTNAGKYGALSTPAGRVHIEWRVTGARGAERFHMSWAETGGPPATPPKSKGFGHLVVERMVAEALQGSVSLQFRAPGLRWTLDADAAAIIKDVQGLATNESGPVQGERSRGD